MSHLDASCLCVILALSASSCSCTPGEERFFGGRADVDASIDAACMPPGPFVPGSVRCATNADCLAAFAPWAESGTLHAVCFGTVCESAETCTATHRGAPDFCMCGDRLLLGGCGSLALCVTLEGASTAACVPICSMTESGDGG